MSWIISFSARDLPDRQTPRQTIFSVLQKYWLTFPIHRNILRPTRTDKGRVAIVFETRSGLWMAATMPDPRGPPGVPGRPADRDRRRRNGRTAQVHVRATVRTNGVASAEVTPLGHGASREIQSRAE